MPQWRYSSNETHPLLLPQNTKVVLPHSMGVMEEAGRGGRGGTLALIRATGVSVCFCQTTETNVFMESSDFCQNNIVGIEEDL